MRIAASAFLLAALSLGAQERQPGTGVNFYSLEKEAALGAALAKEFSGQTTLISNPLISSYVEKIGRQIAASVPSRGYTYTFEVFADIPAGQSLEPVAFPAGYVFVPTSLILAAENEAELAGTLAHAMAHVEERHTTRQATRAELATNITIPQVFAGGGVRSGRSDVALPLGFLAFERQNEIQADTLGAKMAAAAGYDPSALVSYIGRMQKDSGSRVFSRLPMREERTANIEKTIQLLPQKAYAPTSEEFIRIKAEVLLLQKP